MPTSAEMPPRCAGICPIEGMDVERWDIVMTRNCPGPEFDEAPVTDKRVEIRQGGLPLEYPGGGCVGQFVCKNTGVNSSLDHLLGKDS